MAVADGSWDDRWVDEQAGPVVRPYAVTRGRGRPVTGTFDLISLVMTTPAAPPAPAGLGPEHLAIIELCRRVCSVAEIAAQFDLPVGAVRVLLGDLVARGLVQVREPLIPADLPDDSILEAVLHGLRAL
ncbi:MULTISPECIES: DUF742 domain-containing protein [Micromonospora]|uniref:DUF742 domain-containing protein n=1 Tax=Micromonospora yangpuensis TaxID=683228 RepID=A0A1C6UY71_9ACTN|nr:DUF742 domain-containing protein [Micromonospora yangpuensis]GGL95090.1 hypothetical protein GCM10012279_10650 [Micromonospora yangpuensis]SCL58961.1 Protein of unknown function [Micromonospora yangpuensis]